MGICINNLIKRPDWLTIKRGHGILIYSAWQGLIASQNLFSCLHLESMQYIAPDKMAYPHNIHRTCQGGLFKFWNNFLNFSIETCVVGTYQKCLAEALLMSTNYIFFSWRNMKIVCGYPHLIWSYGSISHFVLKKMCVTSNEYLQHSLSNQGPVVQN